MDTTRNTDWQKELIGEKAHITNANLTFSSGTFQTQFLFAGGYYRETFVFRGNNAFQRGSGRLSVRHHSLDDRFKLEVGVNYSSSGNDLPVILSN